MGTTTKSGANLLLSVLSPAALERAGAQQENYEIRSVLIRAEETPAAVFFPHSGAVCSIVRSTSSGQTVEAGVVGAEGAFNLQTLLGAPSPTSSQAIIQNEGLVSRIEIGRLRELFNADSHFRDALLGYTCVYLDQLMQNLVCHRLHSIEQRLAKWLLVMRDRVNTNDLHITQEFLSYMLGVHRPGVSIAVNALESSGVIKHRRNRIELVDREGVIVRSCECFLQLHRKFVEFNATFPRVMDSAEPSATPRSSSSAPSEF